ncbi:MAG: hypothetical protein NTY57_06715 [Solirubrobacterales bacterium]|nr:hypothetical protein [Solirubrobacterales bacterium]
MTFRLGRLRSEEYFLGILGVGLLWMLFAGEWLKSDIPGGIPLSGWETLGILRWLLLTVALLAIGIVPATAARRSAATALAFDVFLVVLAGIGLVTVGLDLVWPPDVLGATGTAAAGGILGCVLLGLISATALMSLRNESRGNKPDPSAPVIDADQVAQDPSSAGQ